MEDRPPLSRRTARLVGGRLDGAEVTLMRDLPEEITFRTDDVTSSYRLGEDGD